MTPPKRLPRATRSSILHRALAEVMLMRMRENRLKKTDVARTAGISRQHVQRLLNANIEVSLFTVTELSRALKFTKEMDLFTRLYDRRQHLLEDLQTQDH